MNESELTRRIYDNLNWARAVRGGPILGGLVGPSDVWSQVQAVWRAPDRAFVKGLYQAILFRPADRAGLAQWCGALARGMSRADLIRNMVRSDEARKYCLDLSWLPELDHPPPTPPRRLSLHGLTTFLRRAMRPRAAWRKVKAGAARYFGSGKKPTPNGDF